MKSNTTMLRLWNLGQDHLVAGRYVAARRALESAEALAWRAADPQSLARIYLPLLEARRQIRYNAGDGLILITSPTDSPAAQKKSLDQFLAAPAGTVLFTTPATAGAIRRVIAVVENINRRARRTGQWFEALLLLTKNKERRLTTAADPFFAAGLPVIDSPAPLAASTDPHLQIPLPPAGLYSTGPEQVAARESLLIAWEALALKWQHRHAPPTKTAWQELAWLRKTLRVDPACEPVTMRLIALAESLGRLNVAP